ncbi:PREDICTED: G patch domain and KOW motifs-containing protein-like isoform X2 [Diuraphis noxia]|uniref:G patch domain and KOW motifs-containing protein-like isoform X2 n=1 Tax=Diuraphis noxia TaxID=143948 RepID=UPI0007635F7A|nr:PREDICTED: G patch domain and KOW motifs-containing protein-like isoform X2 [Diuraphis noxia]
MMEEVMMDKQKISFYFKNKTTAINLNPQQKPEEGTVAEDLVINFPKQKSQEGKETNAEDYETIPIDKFGLAMLRGMGWKPTKGVGLLSIL